MHVFRDFCFFFRSEPIRKTHRYTFIRCHCCNVFVVWGVVTDNGFVLGYNFVAFTYSWKITGAIGFYMLSSQGVHNGSSAKSIYLFQRKDITFSSESRRSHRCRVIPDSTRTVNLKKTTVDPLKHRWEMAAAAVERLNNELDNVTVWRWHSKTADGSRRLYYATVCLIPVF